MNCPKCQSEKLKKNGFVFGVQRYKCCICGHQFTGQKNLHKKARQKAIALSLGQLGVSQNQVSKILNISGTSISRWREDRGFKNIFENENGLQEIEESNLRSYVKNLYVENKGSFLIAKNQFESGYEVDVIIKNKREKQFQTELKVCAFGDSILQGVVHDAQNNKYKILHENFVNLSSKDLHIKWLNYARHGSTIIHGEKAFSRHLSQIQESDYILFSFGGNDCNYDWEKIAQNPNQKHKPALSIDEFHERYIRLIRQAQKKGKTPILFSLPPIHSGLFVKNICLGRNADNIMSFLGGDVGAVYRWHSLYNVEVFKIAKETDIPIIDITTCFLAYPDYRPFICDDGVHPNAKGHQLIAKAVKDYYTKYFQV